MCGEGTTCGVATDKLEIDWDGNYAWGVDCMIPCEKSGDVFTMCGSEAYDGYEIEYACSHLRGGGLGAYWREQNECFHGCDEEEGACILLAPDEGKWCTPTAMTDVEAYPQHCTDDGYVVFCQTNQVVVGICDREAGYACHALSDNSYAGCYTSDDMCDSLGAVSDKKCFVQLDGQEFVVSYTCRETTENGVYVWKMNTDNPTDYEKCDVNCVDATETEEAHCGQLDSRIGQSCTKDEAETGNICGDNDVVLSCYSDGTQRTWHSADNCKGKGETCLTTAAGTSAACYGSATGCTQGEANTHHCSEHEGMGTTLVMSFTYACTEMSDGSFHRISAGSDNCGNAGCNESTGEVECTSSDQCTDPAKPFCNANGVCVADPNPGTDAGITDAGLDEDAGEQDAGEPFDCRKNGFACDLGQICNKTTGECDADTTVHPVVEDGDECDPETWRTQS